MSKRPPASIRNRNPGAMYPGKSAKKFGATSHEVLRSKDGTHKIATFPTDHHGAAALFDLLASPAYTGRTIRDAIKKWCGGYYVGTYIRVLEERTGVRPDDLLTKEMVHNAQVAVPIAKAMAWQEAGRDYPMDDDDWHEAHKMAFAGQVAPAWTPDNDVPTRTPEDRRDDAVKTAATTTAAGGAVVGASEAAKWAPPDLSSWFEWKTFAAMGADAAAWASANTVVFGLAIATAGAVWIWRTR